MHARGLENVASRVGIAGYFFSASVSAIKIIESKFMIPEEIPGRRDATLRTKYDTGGDLFALEALASSSTFFEF